MKKVFTVSVLIGLFAVLVAPQLALAQQAQPTTCNIRAGNVARITALTGWSCTAGSCDLTTPGTDCPGCCTMNLIFTITDWIFFALVALATIFILLGAFNILTAGGNAEKVTTGRSYILWAAIGLIVALLARVIPSLARFFVGV